MRVRSILKVMGTIGMFFVLTGCAPTTPGTGIPGENTYTMKSPEGVRWMLQSFGYTKQAVPTEAYLFLDGGRFDAYNGCNHIGGHYRLGKEKLHLDPETSTLVACLDHGLSDRVGRELATVRFYRIDEQGHLLLYPHKGSTPTLIFRAQ